MWTSIPCADGRPNRLWQLLAVACCLGMLACEEEKVARAPTAPAPLAILESVRGTVTLEREGAKGPAQSGYLFAKDVLETGTDSGATVRWSGGRTLEVGSDARLVLSKGKAGLVMSVERGLVLSRVSADAPAGGDSLPGVSLTLMTPFGLTRVGSEPSELSVEVKQGEGRVDVTLGAVAFVGKEGKEVQARAGQSIVVSAGAIEILDRSKPAVLELSVLEVRLTPSGKVELKKKGSSRWSKAPSKGAPLQPGDSLRVRSGKSEVSVSDSPNRLTFFEGTELLFGGVKGASGVEEAALELKTGRGLFSLSGDRKSRVVVHGLQLESDLGGAFTLVRTGAGIEVTSVVGDLLVRRGDATYPVRAGEVLRVDPKREPATAQSAEDPIELPSRMGLKVFHPGLSTVALTWDGAPAEFDVEVALDSQFQQRVFAGRVHQARVSRVPIPFKGELHWRIVDAQTRAKVDQGSARFAPEPSARDLARLRNEVPEGKEETTIYFQDKPPSVTFTFDAIPQAASYRVRVYSPKNLTAPVAERNSTGARVALEEGILGEGSYVWSVTPMSAQGEELQGGRMNKLEIVYDNSVAGLVIKAPQNGAANTAGLRAVGIAPVNANVIINGRTVPLDDKHRFDVATKALGAPPVLVFRLIRPGSPDSYTVRRLAQAR